MTSKKTTQTLDVPPAIRKYMQHLELKLKQIPGLCPEDALADTRNLLIADYESLKGSIDSTDLQSHYDGIISKFGTPEQLAEGYAEDAAPVFSSASQGCAPGWRICCTTCGRSAPLATTGAIRLGAFSHHKYILGRCKKCNRLRWCRLLKDMEQTNLTERLCSENQTPQQLRKSMHRSMLSMVLGIILLVILIQAIVWLLLVFVFRVFDK